MKAYSQADTSNSNKSSGSNSSCSRPEHQRLESYSSRAEQGLQKCDEIQHHSHSRDLRMLTEAPTILNNGFQNTLLAPTLVCQAVAPGLGLEVKAGNIGI